MDIDIERIAQLAYLSLKEDEKEPLKKDLNKILKHVEELNELDVSKVEPTSHVLNLENVYRKDVPSNDPLRDAMLKNAPDSEGVYFKVPKVIEES